MIENTANLGVSENGGTPKSSNLIGISIYKSSILGYPLFLETRKFAPEICPQNPNNVVAAFPRLENLSSLELLQQRLGVLGSA